MKKLFFAALVLGITMTTAKTSLATTPTPATTAKTTAPAAAPTKMVQQFKIKTDANTQLCFSSDGTSFYLTNGTTCKKISTGKTAKGLTPWAVATPDVTTGTTTTPKVTSVKWINLVYKNMSTNEMKQAKYDVATGTVTATNFD